MSQAAARVGSLARTSLRLVTSAAAGIFLSLAPAGAQDASIEGVWQDLPDVGSGYDDLRIFHAGGRYEERHASPATCRPYLAERHGTWALEGDVIVVTFSRSVRVTGGTPRTSDEGGCAYDPETRATRRESHAVRWRTSACSAEEAEPSAARCLRLAGRPWFRLGDVSILAE